MEEIILNVVKGLVMVSALTAMYKVIAWSLPEYIQFMNEERMTVEERMELRKSRGQL